MVVHSEFEKKTDRALVEVRDRAPWAHWAVYELGMSLGRFCTRKRAYEYARSALLEMHPQMSPEPEEAQALVDAEVSTILDFRQRRFDQVTRDLITDVYPIVGGLVMVLSFAAAGPDVPNRKVIGSISKALDFIGGRFPVEPETMDRIRSAHRIRTFFEHPQQNKPVTFMSYVFPGEDGDRDAVIIYMRPSGVGEQPVKSNWTDLSPWDPAWQAPLEGWTKIDPLRRNDLYLAVHDLVRSVCGTLCERIDAGAEA